MNVYDIHYVTVPLGENDYERPCIIVGITGQTDRVLAISTKISDYYRRNRDFLLDASHADFRMTGLPQSSFVYGQHEFGVPRRNVGRYCGKLAGKLLADFRKWYA